MSLAVGDLPPSFCLEGVDGTTGEPVTVELDSTRGSPVVVAFYPADDSPVCTAQLSDYSASIASLHDLGAQVLAISPQSPRSHAAFAAARGGFEFPLLSDEDLPSGDELGAEFERFLAQQTDEKGDLRDDNGGG